MQRFRGFTVGERPHFETASAVQVFARELMICRSYFEYGSGGSTVLAARSGKPFISIDSDRWFHRSVRKKVGPSQGLYRSIDIGTTGPWGIPEPRDDRSGYRLARFDRYSNMCRHLAETGRGLPDFVLIDGRFRLACALRFVEAAGPDASWRLAFDDYRNRAYYHLFDRFARRLEQHGNWVLFGPADRLDLPGLAAAIDACRYDWR